MIPREVFDIIITDELAHRHSAPPNYLREKLVFRDLADGMANNPKDVLPRLVRLAMDACGTKSASAVASHPRREVMASKHAKNSPESVLRAFLFYCPPS